MENLRVKGVSQTNTIHSGELIIINEKTIGLYNGIATVFVEKDSFGLFTGLTDKNGTEIYHKDKFTINGRSGTFEVVFYRGAFGYIFADGEDNFFSFDENFANLKGKGTQLNVVEVVTNNQ